MAISRFFLWLALALTAILQPALAFSQSGIFPQRIVSLGPINTENVFLLGAGDRLVADTSYCVHPAAARDKVKIGSVMQLNIEQILSLQPDLILATGLTSPQQVAQLAASGVRVVHFPQPQGFAAICAQFLELGKLLGLEARAREIIAEAQKEVRAIQQRIKELPARKVFLQVGAHPLFASVPSSFTNDYIVLAGGINIAAGQHDGRYNREKVTAQNPDVIIIAVMGSEGGIGARERDEWLRFAPISAVQNRQVFVVDPDIICSPSPLTFVKGLVEIAALIHPQEGQ
ncbi:MAG: ABC transporter substrate-binding protein [Proteobacteria bacterium]|nr:ABC transporter substrate-binding protein [Pseudomonadota bacterium]MBU1647965.1 ABC transporter substrate-binding protein [Pseudomonadota bacterium]MBU1986417.1 ABC transporter substrate-binding protein [Pseudomonadota bacterium]